MPKVIGITGGIATGKSAVMSMLARLGAQVLSADDVARQAMAREGVCHDGVVERFGAGILNTDGEIDRAELARIIFSDSEAKRDLEEITHPHIIAQINERIRQFRDDYANAASVLAVEIPLLMECGLQEIVDEVVVVAAEPEAQLSRLTMVRGLSDDQARRMMAAQMPVERKVLLADRVIWNNDSLESLESLVRAFWAEIYLP
ncbi:MAG: dephospho-CoA kinase [Armatimonadetes bacterium]|nr:dephospho-CoA kinase [Armatimonadota bacterium]